LVPDNFTVPTGASADQSAKPLKESGHGMFSYFLINVVKREADQDQVNTINAAELNQNINIIQQSLGSQTSAIASWWIKSAFILSITLE